MVGAVADLGAGGLDDVGGGDFADRVRAGRTGDNADCRYGVSRGRSTGAGSSADFVGGASPRKTESRWRPEARARLLVPMAR
jgi:hypothetical protein